MDALLLAGFVTIKPGDIVVDLGTGCGIILLSLLATKPVGFAFGLEIQKELAHQAARNALLNGFHDRMFIIRGDMRRVPMVCASADVVVCNPPYGAPRSGRINPNLQRAIARHEVLASLAQILETATSLLDPKGRVAMVYPATRLVDIITKMRAFNLEPKRIRMVHPHLTSEAKLVLIEAHRGGRQGLKILPPILDQGEFSISYEP